MRWQSGRRSSNIEDRRSGGLGGAGIRLGGVGTLVAIVLALVFGVDPRQLFGLVQDQSPSGAMESGQTAGGPKSPIDDFVAAVLGDTEDTWRKLLASHGGYRDPKLVLFRQSTSSACGQGQASMGPFYCPLDEKIYLDLSFFEDLQRRFTAPGDFAQAYVIAHEVGHHVQRLLGTSERIHQERRRGDEAHGNALSVRLELQADCYAGVWAHHADKSRQVLEQGDVEEALTAAAAIGDDRLQKQARGYTVPESFTHGTSAQRVKWFQQGLRSGSLEACDTFTRPDP